ncbi:hypothetical protein [uncultured Clostridium sp.]|uniref:hypothetical protein n=1 Tax=uncultured Clostridium sp. TaxID=59620 RepID=UPI0027DC1505|nr:hypothetical protein [uncultured Clostridium sp.]
MIKIIGKPGYGASFFTNLAIEKLLETSSDYICILIDMADEFLPLIKKMKGIDINGEPGASHLKYEEYILSRLDKENFFRINLFVFNNCLIQNEIEKIELLEKSLQSKIDKQVMVIYKTSED